MIKHPSTIPFEYSRITPYIYLGSNACCKVHFSSVLLRKGIKADISLEDERIEQPWGVKYFLWLPTKNHLPPSIEQLHTGAVFLQEMASHRIKAYVHCQRGHGRAPTLVAAYLITQGMGAEDALKFIRKRRPAVHLDRMQREALKKFEKKYKTRKGK